jgi:integrase
LLEFPALADCPLDAIGKKLINEYKVFARRTKTRARTVDGKRVKQPYQISPATVNRTLATLRMILYQALDEDVIEAVPKIGKAMLKGERQREFVLSPAEEPFYLEACPEPLQDAALLILDTGLRDGEALSLSWPDIHLEHAGSKFGYVHVRKGKGKNAKRDIPLTPRALAMLARRKAQSHSKWVFPGKTDRPFLVTSLDHQHADVRALLGLDADFVVHSLRHTMLTRLGLAGADVFTIKQIAGHSSIQMSEKYVHPSSESKERAMARLIADYQHLGHATIDGEANEHEPRRGADSPQNAHSGPSVVFPDRRKLLQ